MNMLRKLSKKQKVQRERLIRYYVRKRYSANLIQQKLREKGLGMRRKELLAKVREVKGVPKKPYAERYVPIKYLSRAKRKKGLGKCLKQLLSGLLFMGLWMVRVGVLN